jgi:hypothetical protein
MRSEIVELLVEAFCEIASETPSRPGWWCSNGRSTATYYGDKLVELGVYERHHDGLGRVQWYRPRHTGATQ